MSNTKPCATPLTQRGLRTLRKNARILLKESEQLRKKYLKTLADQDAILLESAIAKLQSYCSNSGLGIEDIPGFETAVNSLENLLGEVLGDKRKSAIREYAESIIYAVVIALCIRTALVEPFKIPTGSMIPTLEINDHIFVSKFAYGIRIPFTNGVRLFEIGQVELGDVIVFENPAPGEDEGKDFIKRVVGLAGDRVRLQENKVVLNGEPIETLFGGIGPCADTSGRECAFQDEYVENLTYTTQHVVPKAYRAVSGETLGGIARKVGLDKDELIKLNQYRLDRDLLQAPDRFTRPLPDGVAIQIRSPDRWNFGNSANWPLSRPACPLQTQAVPCYGAQAQGNEAFPDVVVPEGHVLVFGDNRDNSRDGRFWGFVPLTHVKGKAFIIWYAEDTTRIFNRLN